MLYIVFPYLLFMSNASWIVLIEFVCLQLFLLFSEIAGLFSSFFHHSQWLECLFCTLFSLSQLCSIVLGLLWPGPGCRGRMCGVWCAVCGAALVLFVRCLLSVFRLCNHWERRTNVLLLMKLIGTLTGLLFCIWCFLGAGFALFHFFFVLLFFSNHRFCFNWLALWLHEPAGEWLFFFVQLVILWLPNS